MAAAPQAIHTSTPPRPKPPRKAPLVADAPASSDGAPS
jgi:hypothetical protein